MYCSGCLATLTRSWCLMCIPSQKGSRKFYFPFTYSMKYKGS
nr:MAG TPA: NPC intracellular cholesterol transporter 1-Pick C disease, cholesterol transport [Caudoviricetes sp.]